jgi:transcription elongation factor
MSQRKITKKVESKAPYVEVRTDGIDNLIIEESDSNQLEMIISDVDGLGVIEDFSCNDFNCVLKIATELQIDNPQTNKINQFPLAPPSNVSAVVKIPKDKKVTVFGETIDIQTQGYQGILRILIDKGNVRIKGIKGITEVNLFTGTVFATVDNETIDVRTRKGTITVNEEVQKSPYKKKLKKAHKFIVKSINANVVLTQR